VINIRHSICNRTPFANIRASLLLTILSLVLSSCGGTKINKSDTTPETEDPEYIGPNGIAVSKETPPQKIDDKDTATKRNIISLDSAPVAFSVNQTGPGARRLRRMSAAQFNKSLTAVTGQVWSQFDAFAGVLGQPNYIDSMEENLAVSVGFIKLIGDAARETCSNAINSDDGTKSLSRIIMWKVNISNPTEAQNIETLKYLFKRFHSTIISADDDSRLRPFLAVLDDTLDNDDTMNDGDAAPNLKGSRQEIKDRWLAVCVGLIMHPDFYSY